MALDIALVHSPAMCISFMVVSFSDQDNLRWCRDILAFSF
jgi:hypothetical protein